MYTPQMVVNGSAQALGSDPAAVERAVLAQKADTGVRLSIVHTEPVGSVLQVTFLVEGLAQAPAAGVYAVIADDMASSQVLRGENRGRTLTHAAVARSLTQVASLTRSPTPSARTQTVLVVLPPPLAGQPPTRRHLVMFVQEGAAGKVLAVESKPL